MVIKIDQSNKIEQTNKNTIIGLSNSKTFTVVIKKQDKRRLKEEFRKRGNVQLFIFRTFIAGVVLMLKYSKINSLSEIIIDQEYFGHEKILRSMFMEMWSRYFENVPSVRFASIGKKSKAHKVSYLTAIKRIKADKKIDFAELKSIVLR